MSVSLTIAKLKRAKRPPPPRVAKGTPRPTAKTHGARDQGPTHIVDPDSREYTSVSNTLKDFADGLNVMLGRIRRKFKDQPELVLYYSIWLQCLWDVGRRAELANLKGGLDAAYQVQHRLWQRWELGPYF